VYVKARFSNSLEPFPYAGIVQTSAGSRRRREEDAEFVVCQMCGEVFDAAEFADILNEVNEEGSGSDSLEAPTD